MKHEHYEFIEEDHIPDIEKMRKAAENVKDAGPWIIDPLYGFMMDKDCEHIDFCDIRGEPNENFEFVSACNPKSVSYLLGQHDTYRDLCGDLLNTLKDTRANCSYHLNKHRPVFLDRIELAITKAEAVMGENSNG